MTTYTMFLDDERHPVDETEVVVRSFDEARDYVLTHGVPRHINFDHDIGPGKSGYDFALWLIDHDLEGNGFPESWAVHSQNPIGAKNINGAMDRYAKFRSEQLSDPMRQ